MKLIVALHNIQGIEDYVFEFPETGVVEFVGDNSNGKSILMNALASITSLTILDTVDRDALIRRGASEGEITIGVDNFVLSVTVRRERKDCEFKYKDVNDQDWVVRTFADKDDFVKAVQRLGFGVFGKERLCIQLHETRGSMPFVSRQVSPQVNSEIIESITRDLFAVACIDNYRNNTDPLFRETVRNIVAQIGNLERLIDSYKIINLEKYQEISKQLDDCLLVKDLNPISFRKLDLTNYDYYPTISFKRLLLQPIIPPIQFIKLEIPPEKIKGIRLQSLSQDIADLNNIENHKCYACGQYI